MAINVETQSMHKTNIATAATLLAISFSGSAKAPAARSQCAGLIGQYRTEIDTASKYGALNLALGDNISASDRSANEAREGNALTRATMAREAIKAAGCKAPVLVASPDPYMPFARGCARDTIMSRYGGSSPATCNPLKWTLKP